MSLTCGPRTPEGKAITSRNAVTHGLFARETVLPDHGEDPAEYTALLDELTRDLRPQNLLERHCVQTIAAAFWRLRRFHEWEAARQDDPELTSDEQLRKMERAYRAESTLHRRINTALKQLGRDLPDLLKTRARLALPDTSPEYDTRIAPKNSQNELPSAHNNKNSQNEPHSPPRQAAVANATSLSPSPVGERCPMRADRGSVADDNENCQNELPPPSQLDLIRAARTRRKQKR